MESQFDALAKRLAAPSTRRGALGLLGRGTALVALVTGTDRWLVRQAQAEEEKAREDVVADDSAAGTTADADATRGDAPEACGETCFCASTVVPPRQVFVSGASRAGGTWKEAIADFHQTLRRVCSDYCRPRSCPNPDEVCDVREAEHGEFSYEVYEDAVRRVPYVEAELTACHCGCVI